ncbi:MAG: FAD:protein FMN transferase [Betaproteobacteria bacterium]|nr:FAD:protein FMN transferase [Betaproteobacteria bacterium]
MNGFRFRFKAMGGPAELLCCSKSKYEADHWFKIASHEITRFEKKYSRYRSSSLVSRINAAAGQSWTACDQEALHLFGIARTFFEQSDGLFDITAGVLRKVWNFKSRQQPTPSLESLRERAAALKHLIGFDRIEFDGTRVRLSTKGVEIDFGGFGKEYATDLALTKLLHEGLEHGYLNLAGDFRFAGPRPDGSPWQIGIQHPRDPHGLLAVLPIMRGGLASSGDYERYIELEGLRYCHILSPHTGWPVEGWQSVSVVASSCLEAGFHTTMTMLKQGDGRQYLRNLGLPYLARDAFGILYQQKSA